MHNIARQKLQFIHKLTASYTSKTAKITKRSLPTSASPKYQCAAVIFAVLDVSHAVNIFIANLRCSTQCDDVTTVQYKSLLHGCIARMYPCAYGTFTAEAENSPLCDRHSGSTQYGKPTLDLQVALSASPK